MRCDIPPYECYLLQTDPVRIPDEPFRRKIIFLLVQNKFSAKYPFGNLSANRPTLTKFNLRTGLRCACMLQYSFTNNFHVLLQQLKIHNFFNLCAFIHLLTQFCILIFWNNKKKMLVYILLFLGRNLRCEWECVIPNERKKSLKLFLFSYFNTTSWKQPTC